MKTKCRVLCVYFLLTFLFLMSCEKVIDLKLKNTEPKIVIEALFSNEFKNHEFYISRTLKFEENTQRNGIEGATVILSDNLENSYKFEDLGNGVYRSIRLRGIPGRTYNLSVTYLGKTYIAQSKMPNQVIIDYLTQTESTFFNETRNAIEVTYSDPAQQENYYYFQTFVNQVPRNKLYVESDRFTNGKEVKQVLYFDEPNLLSKDIVKVRMFSIEPNVFRYLYSIAAIDGSSGPPVAPANPESNFNNGALGFFSAAPVSEKTIQLK